MKIGSERRSMATIYKLNLRDRRDQLFIDCEDDTTAQLAVSQNAISRTYH